ncbi:hypothetical protein Dda_0393 [Drechslerella dactyloides]|uniref:Uncharacterized protein n=1 Tax=Drechslerella dactyloides TaxID=74499 RepID=A0AAD6NML7_DREDA|nr:hypothetical protein Dda_0393 [Drechslerella dactyloides]
MMTSRCLEATGIVGWDSFEGTLERAGPREPFFTSPWKNFSPRRLHNLSSGVEITRSRQPQLTFAAFNLGNRPTAASARLRLPRPDITPPPLAGSAS